MTAGTDHPGSVALPGHRGAMRAATVVEQILAACGVGLNGPARWDLQVKDERFFRRVLLDGSLGLGESYMDGWWECERIDELVDRLLRSDALAELPFQYKARIAQIRALSFNRQTLSGARVSIPAHYDIGNDFFEKMLGRSMAYSCAYWPEANDLDAAQDAKHELICRKLDISPGDRVLDIGCGWGGFARYAARHRGCQVVGVTISPAQLDYAVSRSSDLPVDVRLLDYRASELEGLGAFDKVVSIGMFEHVGAKNYATFMRRVSDLMKADGLFLLHTIGRHESDATDHWLCKYIFPEGMLPSAAEIGQAADGLFLMEDWHNFRADYDRTLMVWNENFDTMLAERSQDFDERFTRMWRFYLLACAGNFRAGRRNQLWQVVFSKCGRSVPRHR
jgi:cyclopropane-fatty-acyl-phospholipid synthase